VGYSLLLSKREEKKKKKKKDGSCDTSYIDGGVHQVQDASGSKSGEGFPEGEGVLL